MLHSLGRDGYHGGKALLRPEWVLLGKLNSSTWSSSCVGPLFWFSSITGPFFPYEIVSFMCFYFCFADPPLISSGYSRAADTSSYIRTPLASCPIQNQHADPFLGKFSTGCLQRKHRRSLKHLYRRAGSGSRFSAERNLCTHKRYAHHFCYPKSRTGASS